VSPDHDLAANWRNGAAYAPLLLADRSVFAWEWLRRDPLYRRAAEGSVLRKWSPEAEKWGLVAFEAPDLSGAAARPVWSAAAHPAVLPVLARARAAYGDSFELERVSALSTMVAVPGRGEHLLISDGRRTIRLDVLAGTLAGGPVELRYLLNGLAAAEKPLLTLRRFLALARTSDFARSLHPREPRARRWVLMLRAWDAACAGADQREIAQWLLSRQAGEPRWRSLAPSVRSQVQRLVQGARLMARGGYRRLLG
jgi:hypothetical protein